MLVVSSVETSSLNFFTLEKTDLVFPSIFFTFYSLDLSFQTPDLLSKEQLIRIKEIKNSVSKL